MKTLSTLTTVAALIAGISVAAAQMSPSYGPSGSSTSNNSMNSTQHKVTGTSKYCLDQSGALNCRFASLASCQQAAKGNEQCSPNPNSGTTGAK